MSSMKVSSRVGRPVYTHDCEDCVFLGHVVKNDLYFCDLSSVFTDRPPLRGERTYTIIARDSSRPENYNSGGEEMIPHSVPIEVGHALAQAYGLL